MKSKSILTEKKDNWYTFYLQLFTLITDTIRLIRAKFLGNCLFCFIWITYRAEVNCNSRLNNLYT